SASACSTSTPLNANSNVASPEPTPAANTNVGQRVTFESADKTVIVGSFFESAKPNSPAVLLLHQFASNRHSYDDLARQLQAKGFGVLAIDGRGFGESTKTSDGKTVAVSRSDDAVKGMLADVSAAFDFLSKQKSVDPTRIGIVGASYGSSLALIYAADNPKVAAITLLSPGLNYFGNMPTEPAIKKYGDRPLYMLAAEDDKESADAVRKLGTAGNNVKYGQKIYPVGGHGTALLATKTGGRGEIEWFFSDRFGLNK
ncbi:MAG TPA: alpha/beta fold hydrolase, partial [Pyrinomonadaceae bacterium]|nr:alpha/beta fold hydrolase [Pyrinomonadaceae bacterium]